MAFPEECALLLVIASMEITLIAITCKPFNNKRYNKLMSCREQYLKYVWCGGIFLFTLQLTVRDGPYQTTFSG